MADLSPELAANYVLWVADDRTAQQPGQFFELLTRATFHADRENRALIHLGFPNLAEAVHLYKNTEDGYKVLRERAGLAPREDET